MAMSAITTKAPKAGDRQITVNYDLGEGLQEKVKLFGEQIVDSHAESSITVALQGIVRTALEKGVPDEDIHKLIAGWKPGVKTRIAMNAEEAFFSQFAAMSPEEQAQKIKEFQDRAKAARG